MTLNDILDSPTQRARLTSVCEILAVILEEDHNAAIRNRNTLVGSRTPMPSHHTLPEGHCTFTYECNRDIEHWRYLHDRDKWIPVCRSHRGRR